jgi:DNA-binding transcriptional regulator YiaG
MEKLVKRFTYDGLGFPLILTDVVLVKARGVWTPAIDYNKLQKVVLVALSHKPFPLTGNEVHFVRACFEMTLQTFGKYFGVTHVAVMNWEKTKNQPAKISPPAELYVRLFILDKLKISNQIFRETFREFDIQKIAKEQKSSVKEARPLQLPSSGFRKRSALSV